ncbi:MAG TPA: hypothetical protein VNV41_10055 [Candidatus Acidoferrales bacterium]|nr:hypothetical protein [Candidatus Acidoferrales bacterium]
MRSSKPPVQATWLVEHLIPGPRNEALAGDLLEQFSQGRSVTWYWRQVLVAILTGFLTEWRIFAWAAVVTVCWAIPLYYGRFGNKILAQYAFGLETHRWFLPLIYATVSFTWLAFGPICFASVMYWVMTTDLTMMRKAFPWLSLLEGYLAVAFSTFLLLALLPPAFVENTVGLLPVFLGMLVSMWAFRRDSTGKRTAKFFRILPPRSW